jgi:CBS domain-containing protein
VKEAMTTIERTFMVSVDEKLSFEMIAKIFKTGYSRIPVFEVSRDNVIGLLFVKDLIFIDPEDEVPIRSFVQIFGRSVHVVWPDDSLGDVLTELKKGRSHLALVRDVNNTDESQDPFYEIKGIITLEGEYGNSQIQQMPAVRSTHSRAVHYLHHFADIIEKIIGDSIVDETDAFADRDQEVKVIRAESFEWARLRLLDSKIVDELLSPSEVKAVTAHLRMNYSATVELLTDAQLKRFVATTPVSQLDTATQELGKELPNDLMYENNVPSDMCTLLLGGRVTIVVGSENFRSDVSSWSVLGKAALENPTFTPDFSAFVSDGPCRCLRFKHKVFVDAVDASAIERQSAHGKVLIPMQAPQMDGTTREISNLSSDIPNRREKLIAEIFKNESDAEIFKKINYADSERPEKKESPSAEKTMVVRFQGAEGMETKTTVADPREKYEKEYVSLPYSNKSSQMKEEIKDGNHDAEKEKDVPESKPPPNVPDDDQ